MECSRESGADEGEGEEGPDVECQEEVIINGRRKPVARSELGVKQHFSAARRGSRIGSASFCLSWELGRGAEARLVLVAPRVGL